MNRRTFLGSVSLLTAGLAGCSSDGNTDGTRTATGTDDSPTEGTAGRTTGPGGTPRDTTASLAAFERDLAQTDIEVQVLELQQPIVVLEYGTAESEFEGVSRQIGTISGFFFRQIREGWDVSRLDAEADVGDGPVFTWHAESEWYERFEAGEITADELSLRVLDTAERAE